MTIASEISRLQTAKADIKSSIEGKGVTVPSSAKLDSYDDYIDQIQSGGGGGVGSSATTMTVTWTEASDPAQFNPIYSDDATGLTAGSSEFDAFFGYSAVKLDSNGKETERARQSEPGILDITQLSDLTSGDNVMIKFPIRGIKMTKSGSNVTLSITKEINKSGYQYYAFTRDSILKPNLYLGAFKGSRVNNVLKSWSGQGAATSASTNGISYISLSDTTTGARACARANNTSLSTGSNGRDEISWYARNYVNAMYMMKYGHGNGQTAIGRGYVDSNSAAHTTGGSWSDSGNSNATWGESTGKKQMRLFGLEDWRGNVYEWLDGAFFNSTSNLRTSTNNVLTNTSWSGTIFNQDVTVQRSSPYYLKGISGTNTGMFAGTDTTGSNSTYYCDYFGVGSGDGLRAGGGWSSGSYAGPFSVANYGVSYAYNNCGARLMFL